MLISSNQNWVSVPLSGLLFLNDVTDVVIHVQEVGFRPLIGVIISKQKLQQALDLQGRYEFPSPYRGYYF